MLHHQQSAMSYTWCTYESTTRQSQHSRGLLYINIYDVLTEIPPISLFVILSQKLYKVWGKSIDFRELKFSSGKPSSSQMNQKLISSFLLNSSFCCLLFAKSVLVGWQWWWFYHFIIVNNMLLEQFIISKSFLNGLKKTGLDARALEI